MNKLISSLILCAFAIAGICMIDSCSKTSTINACVGNIPSTASAGVAVSFRSCTVGASSYKWSFGDGVTDTGQSATHIYATAGTYTGTLTVTDNNGSNSKNFSITIVNNNWTFKGNSFTADSVVGSVSGGDLIAYGVSGSSKANIAVLFSAFPTVSGNYTIINANSGAEPVGQQLYVIVYSYSASNVETIYGSTGSGNGSAVVTVSGGKLSVAIPAIEVSNLSNASDSTSFAAAIYQTQ